MTAAAFIVGAYLVGAIPFGLLIGLALGKDIRKEGSGNIGATNAGRILGRKWGFLCLLLDILKGLLPTVAARAFLIREPVDAAMLTPWILVAAATVIGHTFPIYLGFRGGKGVATTIGAALGLYPWLTIAMTAGLIAYGAGRFATGMVSVGSLLLAVAFPAAFFAYVAYSSKAQLTELWPLGVVSAALGLLIIVRHRSNIARLLSGEEHAVRNPKPDKS